MLYIITDSTRATRLETRDYAAAILYLTIHPQRTLHAFHVTPREGS